MQVQRQKASDTVNIDGELIKREEINKKYNVSGMIRLRDDEFNHIKGKKHFTRFNLQTTGHKVGEKYLLVRIVKPGFYTRDKQQEPILTLNGAVVAKCVEVKNNVDYQDVTDFENSGIENPNQLKQIILHRYQESMPELTKAQILGLGVAITKLEL